MKSLNQLSCTALDDITALSDSESRDYCQQLESEWELNTTDKTIQFDFSFKNYYETIAFVNALAWVSHQQDHHPDLEVGYKHCRVRYSTHSVGGLSLKDFICAARIENLTTSSS